MTAPIVGAVAGAGVQQGADQARGRLERNRGVALAVAIFLMFLAFLSIYIALKGRAALGGLTGSDTIAGDQVARSIAQGLATKIQAAQKTTGALQQTGG